jgi:transcription antitermination factor NusG
MSYWSVVQTESQRERIAAEFLREAKYEIYLPRILMKKREVPLFPGYLFVTISSQWWAVRWSIGVIRVLMDGEMPAKVPGKVVDAIKRREGGDGLVRLPKIRGLERGDPVRILKGSFAGHLAIYDGMSGEMRVCVLLEFLGRKTRMSLGRGDVEAVTTAVVV